jgi:ABC-type multidrug transport system ATPase subunit
MIRIKNLYYQHGENFTLYTDNWDIEVKKHYYLIGASGSGKSTLLKLIAGELLPLRGLLLDNAGRPLENSNVPRRIYMAQHPALWEHMTAGEYLNFILNPGKRKHPHPQSSSWLKRVELPGYENRPIPTLSGGERQRLALAGILALQPEILLLDEPFASLDPIQADMLGQLIDQLRQSCNFAVVEATHHFHRFDKSRPLIVIEENRARFFDDAAQYRPSSPWGEAFQRILQ